MYCSAFAFAVLPSAFSIGNCIVVCVHRQVVKHAWRTKEKGRGWNSGGTAHSPAVKSKDTLGSPKGRNWGKQTHNDSETHNDSQTLLFRLGLWFRIHQHAAWQLKPPYSCRRPCFEFHCGKFLCCSRSGGLRDIEMPRDAA